MQFALSCLLPWKSQISCFNDAEEGEEGSTSHWEDTAVIHKVFRQLFRHISFSLVTTQGRRQLWRWILSSCSQKALQFVPTGNMGVVKSIVKNWWISTDHPRVTFGYPGKETEGRFSYWMQQMLIDLGYFHLWIVLSMPACALLRAASCQASWLLCLSLQNGMMSSFPYGFRYEKFCCCFSSWCQKEEEPWVLKQDWPESYTEFRRQIRFFSCDIGFSWLSWAHKHSGLPLLSPFLKGAIARDMVHILYGLWYKCWAQLY